MMKKLFLSLFSLLMVLSTINAQDAGKASKGAKKALGKYKIETDVEKKAKLLETARANIDVAIDGIDAFEGKNLTKVWMMAGEIYNQVSNDDVKKLLTNPEHVIVNKDSGLKSLNAFAKVIETATKSYYKKDAVKGLATTFTNLSNLGLMSFNVKDYKGAYENFNAGLQLRDLMAANGNNDILADPGSLNEHRYLTGMSAMASDQLETSKPIFEELYKAEYKEAGVYDALWKLNKDSDQATALTYLEKGRKLFPEDEGLRISEINYYMSNNKFDVLEDKLKAAIEADPKNVSLYNALGNTYDNLFQSKLKANNLESANKYFNNALSYYNQALEVDGDDFFALYNTGVLYVNRANGYVNDMKVLEDKGDYSKAGLRAVEALKAKADKEFDTSLEFFKKAEISNPNEVNTLGALKEIFARKNDFDTSGEFKKRIETVEGGGTNTSFFEGK